jgi:hypothetical protein
MRYYEKNKNGGFTPLTKPRRKTSALAWLLLAVLAFFFARAHLDYEWREANPDEPTYARPRHMLR